jgi:hypothetical protein
MTGAFQSVNTKTMEKTGKFHRLLKAGVRKKVYAETGAIVIKPHEQR